MQGPATEPYTRLLRSFAGPLNPCTTAPAVLCFFSTWRGAPSAVLSAYAAAGFAPILSTPPPHPGRHNVNLQAASTAAGLRAAQAAGATHALKIRGDVRVTDAARLLRAVVGVPSRLTVLAWVGGGYPTDQVVAGPLEELLRYFSPPLQPPASDQFAEQYLLERYCARTGLSPAAACASMARWLDAEGAPSGGAAHFPPGLAFWAREGEQEEEGGNATDDLALSLRALVTPGDACSATLPPGCQHAGFDACRTPGWP